jgi:subtilisin family serine protease
MMRVKRSVVFFIIALMFLSSLISFTPSPTHQEEQVQTEEKLDRSLLNMTTSSNETDVLVGYDKDIVNLKMENALSFTNRLGKVVEVYQDLDMMRVKIVGTSLLDLARNSFVTHIWSNQVLSIQSAYSNANSTLAEDEYAAFADTVGARDLWNKGYNGSGIVLAVLDTGIDSSHPDLDDFDDNSSTTDPKVAASASFVEVDSLPTDILGPGTYAASIAAGTGNASAGRYSGIAPGATLLAATVTFGGLLALPSWIVSGIQWASSNGADIILMPFNTFGAPNDAVAQAVKAAVREGIFVVAAAGDDGPDYLTIMSPGGGLESFTVGAYDTSNNEVPSFSGRGPSLSLCTKPDIVAPGVGIVGARIGAGLGGFGLGSVDLGSAGGLGDLLGGGTSGQNIDDYYKVADTTAAAAAIVAGAAAILMEAFDRATPIVLANVLRDTATPLPYGANDAGAGLLNLPDAFEYLSTQQNPISPHSRSTGSSLLSFGFLSASGNNASSTLMMSSFGTSTLVIDSRHGYSDIHMLMGTLYMKWNDMEPTSLMNFDVKRELHAITLEGLTSLLSSLGVSGGTSGLGGLGGLGGFVGGGNPTSYGRWVGVLSYEDEFFVTLVVESYNFTMNSTLPLTAYKITPFILNMGSTPIDNVSLYLSYSLDLFGDGIADHGKYDLTNHMLFGYGISEDYRDFYIGVNASRVPDAFEVGNSSEVSSHVTDDNLTMATAYDGSVGLGMKWDFGRIYPDNPVNVSIAMAFGENRTVLDASRDAMWTANPPASFRQNGDFILVEANIPRTAQVGETYESQAIIMNIGLITANATAALATIQDNNGTGTAYAEYFTFQNMKPFHVAIAKAIWKPEEEGIHTGIWIGTYSLNAILGLLSNPTAISTSVVSILDDYITRDIFVVDPIRSTSIFPKALPFAPFNVHFPIDFGMYTVMISTTEELGNITVRNVGNASDWGNATLNPAESVTGIYNFSIFVLVPPITMDGYHRCDYVINSEQGWTTNVTLERVVEYPRSMVLMDTSHGGGFGSLMGESLDIGSVGGLGGGIGGGNLSFPGFLLAQDIGGGTAMGLGGIGDLGSLTDLLESIRLTTFSGLSTMKSRMAESRIEVLEIPGTGLSGTFTSLVAAVMLFAPTEEFNSTDIETYRDFSSSGGKIIVFGDKDGRANLTALNPLLLTYGYYMDGEHDEENTTEIVPGSILGKGLDSMWLGGGTYIYNNQSGASVTLNGKPVVLVDDSPPDLVLFGSSRIFMNDYLMKCNNSILLDNLIDYLLQNTLTCTTSLAENTTRYAVGKSIYLNLNVVDYHGQPVNDLFVAIAFELPNGSFAYFIAGFVENGLYSSQFLPSYWTSDGIVHGIFIILREKYAGTYASVTFELYSLPPTNGTAGPEPLHTLVQLAIATSGGIFGFMLIALMYNRYRRRRRMRIPELDANLTQQIDNTLNLLQATISQINELITREDIDRIEKMETLRGLMNTLERGQQDFKEISGKLGGV